MRRRFFLIILLCLMVFPQIPRARAVQNAFINPSFESSFGTVWVKNVYGNAGCTTGGAVSQSNAQAHTGTFSALVDGTANMCTDSRWHVGVKQTFTPTFLVTAVPTGAGKFSFWILSGTSIGSYHRVLVAITSQEGNRLCYYTVGFAVVDGCTFAISIGVSGIFNSWTQFSRDFRTDWVTTAGLPSTDHVQSVDFGQGSQSTTDGDQYYYDDVYLEVSIALSPSAPRNLAATNTTCGIILTWNTPSSDGGASIINYKVYRGLSPSSEVLIKTLGAVLTYTDNPEAFIHYFYNVTAVNSVGESVPSNTAEGVALTACGVLVQVQYENFLPALIIGSLIICISLILYVRRR